MRTTKGEDRGRRRARLVAVLAAGLLALGVGIAVASPPRSAAFDDADGRTWLAVPGADGERLVLANGLSGLVEADATVDGGAAAGPLRFVASRGRTTLLAGDGRLVTVDDGTHRTASRALAGPATVVRPGVLVLEAGGARARLLPTTLAGAGREVPLPARPVDGAAPVADGRGRPWYLAATSGAGRAAVRLDVDGAGDDTGAVMPVDDATTRLVVVDGHVAAVGRRGTVPVDDDAAPRRPTSSTDPVQPEVVVATGGTWATAAGSVVRTTGASTATEQDLGDAVRALAVWHGRVVAVTSDGVWTGPRGRLAPIPDIGPGAVLHLDGGVLWITTGDRAVAVSPGQEQVAFDLAATDLSLCVGDCSAAAASSFLEDRATTPSTTVPPKGADVAPTTTQPPRRLEAAAVTPTLLTTTTTTPRAAAAPTSTTAPPPAEAAPTSVAASPSTLVGPGSVVTPTGPTTSTTEDDAKPGRRGGGGGGKDEPTTTTSPPVVVLPTILPTPTDPPPDPETTTTEAPSTTDTEATTTTARPAPEPVGLELDVTARPGEATASLRVLARAGDCGEGTSTVATLLWQGATTGTRQLLVTWSNRGAPASNVASATIPSPAGQLSVSVVVCGVTASRTTTVPADPSTTTTAPPTTTTTTPPTTTTTTPSTTTTTTTPSTTTTTTPPTTTTTRPTTTTTP